MNAVHSSEPDLQVFAELFTARNLTRLAWYGSTELTTYASEVLRRAGWLGSGGTLSDVLDCAFGALAKHRPVEYVYKSHALAKTVFGRNSPRTTAFYTEFPVADSRADVLVVNGHATVYEIKTPFDDFSRLGSQLGDYYRCFTRVILLTDADKGELALGRLPNHVGIATLNKRAQITVVREPTDFFDDLDYRSIFTLFRKSEYLTIARDLGFDADGIHPAHLYEACFAAFRRMSIAEALLAITKALKERQATQEIASLCSRLPKSLHLAAFSYRIRLKDWKSIILSQQCPV